MRQRSPTRPTILKTRKALPHELGDNRGETARWLTPAINRRPPPASCPVGGADQGNSRQFLLTRWVRRFYDAAIRREEAFSRRNTLVWSRS
jgi:hypothetical protein